MGEAKAYEGQVVNAISESWLPRTCRDEAFRAKNCVRIDDE